MTRPAVYLDCCATAPIRPEAAEAVARALAIGGNPSSVHARGRAARAVVETARAEVAALAGADVRNLVFTSGGAEANALAIESAALRPEITAVIVSAIEHETVIETAKACRLPVRVAPVDARGVADLDALEGLLVAASGPALVCLMAANNETGVIQPVAEVAALVRARDGLLHVDAVQAAGRLDLDLEALGADTLTLSAHKIGGPQGVGALAYGERAVLSRRLHGGGQERGRRAGTENVSGVAGFGAAATAALADRPMAESRAAWRDAAAERLKAAGALIAGEGAPRLADVLCTAAADWPSELQVIALDLAGVMVSAGSACSSGKVKPSRVLEAMGLGPLAAGALRASGGWSTTEQDWITFADAWLDAFARHAARRRPASAA